MHEFGLLPFPTLHSVAAIARISVGKFMPARVVTSKGFVDVFDNSSEKWIDHGNVVDDDGHEGLSYSPRASLLGTVDGILEEELDRSHGYVKALVHTSRIRTQRRMPQAMTKNPPPNTTRKRLFFLFDS